MAKTRTIHDFELATIDGAQQKLADFSRSGAAGGERGLEVRPHPALQGAPISVRGEEGRGFAVLGFPCNQFGGQEPGSEAEVKSFCATTYGVSFPMFSKIDVNGAGRAPLYAWLTGEPTQPDGPGDIAWNFTKFVIGKDGDREGALQPARRAGRPRAARRDRRGARGAVRPTTKRSPNSFDWNSSSRRMPRYLPIAWNLRAPRAASWSGPWPRCATCAAAAGLQTSS